MNKDKCLRIVRFLLASALAAALLWWLLRGVSLANFESQFAALPRALVLAAPLGLLASYGLRAARVRSELGHLQPVSFASAWQVTLVHNAAVNLLPLRGGELAYPYLVHKQLGIAPTQAVASLLWMRLQDLAVLLFLALLFLLPLPPVWRGLAAVLYIVFSVLALRWLRGYFAVDRAAAEPPSALQSTPTRGWRSALRRHALPVLRALADGPRHSRASWAYSMGNWCLKLLVIGSLLQAAAALPWASAVAGALGGELAALLPLQGPSGLGTYEAGVWGAVALLQKPDSGLPVAALLAHGFIFATALLAGALAGLQMLLRHNSGSTSS